MFRPQNVNVGSYFLQRIPDDKGGPGNPSASIDVNAFRTTNFRFSPAMRGSEFQGNTCRDSTTRILSIEPTGKCAKKYERAKMRVTSGFLKIYY